MISWLSRNIQTSKVIILKFQRNILKFPSKMINTKRYIKHQLAAPKCQMGRVIKLKTQNSSSNTNTSSSAATK